MALGHGDRVRVLLVLDLLVLLAAGAAVPALDGPRDRPPVRQPTPAEAVARLERTWERASRLPGPGALVRRPGVEETDDCGIGVAGSDRPVPDTGRRTVTWVSEPLGLEALTLLEQVSRALREVGNAPRPVSGRGEALGDADGHAWLLRTDGGRAVVSGTTPCLRAVPAGR